jgi:hypothetical protein
LGTTFSKRDCTLSSPSPSSKAFDHDRSALGFSESPPRHTSATTSSATTMLAPPATTLARAPAARASPRRESIISNSQGYFGSHNYFVIRTRLLCIRVRGVPKWICVRRAPRPNCHKLSLSHSVAGRGNAASMPAAGAPLHSARQRFENIGVCLWPVHYLLGPVNHLW